MEPVEIDLQVIMQNIRQVMAGGANGSDNNNGGSSAVAMEVNAGRDGRHLSHLIEQLSSEKKKHQLAEKLQFATQLMVDSQQRHGKSIINRYKAALLLDRKREQTHFELAKYYEYLYREYTGSNGQGATTGGLPQGGHFHSSSSVIGSSSSVASNGDGSEQKTHAYESMQRAVAKYGDSVKLGSKFVLEAIPRMLTLWLSVTSLQEKQSSQGSNYSQISSLTSEHLLVFIQKFI